MDVKDKVLLQLFNKNKLRNGTKTFLEPYFSLFIVKLKKLGFSASLSYIFPRESIQNQVTARYKLLTNYNLNFRTFSVMRDYWVLYKYGLGTRFGLTYLSSGRPVPFEIWEPSISK